MFKHLSKSSKIKKIRILGSIAAFDLDDDKFKYGSKPVEDLKKEFLNKGLYSVNWKNNIFDASILYKEKVLEDVTKLLMR